MADRTPGKAKDKEPNAKGEVPTLAGCRQLYAAARAKRDQAWKEIQALNRQHGQAIQEMEAWKTIALGAYAVDLQEEYEARQEQQREVTEGEGKESGGLDASSMSVRDLIAHYLRRHMGEGPKTPKQVLDGIKEEFGRGLSASAVIVTRDRHLKVFKKVASPRGAFVLIDGQEAGGGAS